MKNQRQEKMRNNITGQDLLEHREKAIFERLETKKPKKKKKKKKRRVRERERERERERGTNSA